MQIVRETFLQRLEAVRPGLSSTETIQQSASFIFQKNKVLTFDGQIACLCPIEIVGLSGAVRAKPLLEHLRLMPDQEIDVEASEKELVITGRRLKFGLQLDKEISLPLDTLEKGREWKPLPEGFSEALDAVCPCAGRDESLPATMCIHFNHKWLEAFDNIHMARFTIDLPLKERCLVLRDAVKHVIPLDMTEISETDNWLHFKNPTGLIVSCRRSYDDFPKLDPYLALSGKPMAIPRGLVEAAKAAEILSAEIADQNKVSVILKPGKIKINSVGVNGWSRQTRPKIKYDGPLLHFIVEPKLLGALAEKHSSCEISDKFLKVNGGRLIYVLSLEKPKKKKEEENVPDSKDK